MRPPPRSAIRATRPGAWGRTRGPLVRFEKEPPCFSLRADPCPHLAGLPLRMAGFACVPAPLALKAVTFHRAPQSSPVWSGPPFAVRAPPGGQGALWSAARCRRFGFPAERADRANAPFSTPPPLGTWAQWLPLPTGEGGGEGPETRSVPPLAGPSPYPLPGGEGTLPSSESQLPLPGGEGKRPLAQARRGTFLPLPPGEGWGEGPRKRTELIRR
jgi:hypothetical protein